MTPVTRAITIRPPWAVAVAAGVKLVENRGRSTSLRGPVAIHAGAAWSPLGGADLRIRRWWWGEDFAAWPPLDATGMSAAFRKVLAVANLVDCHPASPAGAGVGGVVPAGTGQVDGVAGTAGGVCCPPWGDRFYDGRPAWHLVLADVQRLSDSVPAVGRLHVGWKLPPAVVDAVAEQLVAAAGGAR